MRHGSGADPRDARLHRFGIALGLVLALGVHALLLWGPDVSYRPVLERARIRRVMRVRPYVPPPPRPEPPPRPGTGAAKPAPAPRPAPTPARAAPAPAASLPAPAPGPPAGVQPRPGLPEPQVRRPGAPVAESRAEPRPPAPPRPAQVAPEPQPDEWSAVLAELEARRRALGADQGAASGEQEAVGAGPGGAGAGPGEEGYLDPRIRVTVVSYPPTSIEELHPPISYPDLRFHRRELQKGICRVWYRVWTDRTGRIVKTQLKAPASREEQELYAPFVDAVVKSVESWPFERREAEIHVDVLFEIE
ncbi:hypothetical protein [Deferrisoma camini]|uniref:hypothetical protein n=1 Tax=Deferrisoma camini TaxID=1035120 RepID=UPI00046D19BF|nr:hypothetical protein [Deferrisoma camini]